GAGVLAWEVLGGVQAEGGCESWEGCSGRGTEEEDIPGERVRAAVDGLLRSNDPGASRSVHGNAYLRAVARGAPLERPVLPSVK
ncbi:hypothetical protein T484DRAFT_1900590, partial [Baffinella frigidus]